VRDRGRDGLRALALAVARAKMGACMKRAWPPRPSFPLDQAAIPLHRRRVSIKTLAPKRRGPYGTTLAPASGAASGGVVEAEPDFVPRSTGLSAPTAVPFLLRPGFGLVADLPSNLGNTVAQCPSTHTGRPEAQWKAGAPHACSSASSRRTSSSDWRLFNTTGQGTDLDTKCASEE
jgi:hypothetical protein